MLTHAVHGALQFLDGAVLWCRPASLGPLRVICFPEAHDLFVPVVLNEPAVEESSEEFGRRSGAGREALRHNHGGVVPAPVVGFDPSWLSRLQIWHDWGVHRLEVTEHQHRPCVGRQCPVEGVGQAPLQRPVFHREGHGLDARIEVHVCRNQLRVAQGQGVVEAQVNGDARGGIRELHDRYFGPSDGLDVAVVLAFEDVGQMTQHALGLADVLHHEAKVHIPSSEHQAGFCGTERVEFRAAHLTLERSGEVVDDAASLFSLHLRRRHLTFHGVEVRGQSSGCLSGHGLEGRRGEGALKPTDDARPARDLFFGPPPAHSSSSFGLEETKLELPPAATFCIEASKG